jgi:hypothetical protein
MYKTCLILGVGNTAEVHSVYGNEDLAVWLPYDDADLARFKAVAPRLRSAGHAARAGYVVHEECVRSCLFYPRCESTVENADDDETAAIVAQLEEWVAGFRREGLGFYHFAPKHILRSGGGGYVLTGLAHAFLAEHPPPPEVHNFGPFSLVGDSPLMFFSSGTLSQRGVVSLLMEHCVGVCIAMIVGKFADDIVACSTYSSTAAQIRLTVAGDDVVPVMLQHCHARTPAAAQLAILFKRRRGCCVVS